LPPGGEGQGEGEPERREEPSPPPSPWKGAEREWHRRGQDLMDRPIRVLAYAGGRGEERPRGIWRGERAVAVTDVPWGGIEAGAVPAVWWGWIEGGGDAGGGGRRWFRVRLATGEEVAVYYDEALEGWFTPEPGAAP